MELLLSSVRLTSCVTHQQCYKSATQPVSEQITSSLGNRCFQLTKWSHVNGMRGMRGKLDCAR